MGTEIKAIGGLPEGEIRLLISESEARVDNKLNERLQAQDVKIESIQQDMSILVGKGKLIGLVQQIKTTLDTQVAKSEEWHDDDLKFRQGVINRLVSVETNQTEIKDEIGSIRWFVLVSHGLGWSVEKCSGLLKSSDFYKIGLWVVIAWIVSHFAPNLFHAAMTAIKSIPSIP